MTITVTATSDMERLHLVSAILQDFLLPPFCFLFLFILMVACIGTDYSGCSFGDYTAVLVTLLVMTLVTSLLTSLAISLVMVSLAL